MSGVVLHDTPVKRLVYLHHFSTERVNAYQIRRKNVLLKTNSGYAHCMETVITLRQLTLCNLVLI